MTGWDREWAYVQERAGAPRDARLGCSTVSHDRLGFCAFCTPDGADLEVNAWRLLALKP